MRNVELKVVGDEEDPGCGLEEAHAYPWSKCFTKEHTLEIMRYIDRHRS